jgi:hypothetical protein
MILRFKQHWSFVLPLFLLICVTTLVLSQNADSAKGDTLLKEMSRKLAGAQSFSFSTAEFHDRLKRSGQRIQINVTRDVLVQRPNQFWTRYKGERDFEFWYDGKLLTGISNEKKIYIQHNMPPTLDESLDTLAQRFNLDLPMSDVLYSSPYDAFLNGQSRGGFEGKEVIDNVSCNHLSYTGASVDWQLWISEKDSLPCQLEMKYKTDKGNSLYKITFSNWNLKPKIKKDVFAFKIPEGHVRIPILERVILQPGSSTQTQTKPSNNP